MYLSYSSVPPLSSVPALLTTSSPPPPVAIISDVIVSDVCHRSNLRASIVLAQRFRNKHNHRGRGRGRGRDRQSILLVSFTPLRIMEFAGMHRKRRKTDENVLFWWGENDPPGQTSVASVVAVDAVSYPQVTPLVAVTIYIHPLTLALASTGDPPCCCHDIYTL